MAYPIKVLVLVLAQQPDIRELRQTAQFVDLVINFDDFQLQFFTFGHYLHFLIGDLLIFFLKFDQFILIVLLLLLL